MSGTRCTEYRIFSLSLSSGGSSKTNRGETRLPQRDARPCYSFGRFVAASFWPRRYIRTLHCRRQTRATRMYPFRSSAHSPHLRLSGKAWGNPVQHFLSRFGLPPSAPMTSQRPENTKDSIDVMLGRPRGCRITGIMASGSDISIKP